MGTDYASIQVWSDHATPVGEPGETITVTVLSGGTVYYGDRQVSSGSNLGSLTVGQSVAVSVPSNWLRSASVSMVQLTGVSQGIPAGQLPGVAFVASQNAFTSKQTINVAGIALDVEGGSGGANGPQAARIIDKPTGKTLVAFQNIAATNAQLCSSIYFYGDNGTGPADSTGSVLGWQSGIDQAAPTPNRDFVPATKVRASTYTGVVTSAASASITAPGGTFDTANDPGTVISSANIPGITIASVADSSHATLSTGVGVLAGTANAVVSRAWDIQYIFHNGSGPAKVVFFPLSNTSVPSASMTIAGPFGNTTDPTQLELQIAGPGIGNQTANVLQVRGTSDTQPVFAFNQHITAGSLSFTPGMQWGVGQSTAPDLVIGRTNVGTLGAAASASGVKETFTLINYHGASGDGSRFSFYNDSQVHAAIDATDVTHNAQASTMSFKVANGGALVERIRISNNGVAFNGNNPFFPNATPANATDLASAITAINFWNTNLKAYGLST